MGVVAIASLEAEGKGAQGMTAVKDVFPERYEQVMASEAGVLADEVAALFEQIATTPEYEETFRANTVCVAWRDLTKQPPGN
jgi:hypothetical protein